MVGGTPMKKDSSIFYIYSCELSEQEMQGSDGLGNQWKHHIEAQLIPGVSVFIKGPSAI